MQNALGNIGDTAAMPRHQGRVPRIFQEYRNHFGLFWRVMLPVIIVSFVLYSALFLLLLNYGFPEAQWRLLAHRGTSEHLVDQQKRISHPRNRQSGVDSSVTGFQRILPSVLVCYG